MTDRNLRIVTGAMAVALVIVVGWTVLIIGSRDRSSGSTSPSAGASATAGSTGSPGASAIAGASSAASGGASAAPSKAATPKPSTKPSPTPSATAAPVPSATLTFVELMLDATTNSAGQARTITFTSDGPGSITAALTTSTGGKTRMCLKRGTQAETCQDWTKGTLTGTTTQAHTNWRVTVQGSGSATPTVSVKLTYAAVAPKVKMTHARFDGTASPGLNGIQARFVPRAGGQANLAASWGGHPFTYEVDLFNETTNAGGGSFQSDGPATKMNQSYAVTASDTWRILLQNTESGAGTTDMTAIISWP